ncbi:MAG: glutamyl-tRNA reductase [Planctomycetota bacterium]|jgi:glutamyl-tRNA reductase
MEILLVGLNHKTASVDIRQRVAFDEAAALKALEQLKQRYQQTEFVLLSTCNRVELYASAGGPGCPTAEDMGVFLSEYHGIKYEDLKKYLYTSHNEESVCHLMTVTSSLDSMVVGEPQITAQVKESYRLACEVGSAGKVLSRLFHSAFSVCKEIYTSTSISSRRVSAAGVAIELARQLFSDITSAKTVVIGAGQMGELLVEHLLHVKCNDITVVNRSYQRARRLADRHEITADKWDNMDKHLAEANIVVAAATAIQGCLFDKSTFAEVMNKRRGRTLLVIDIAVPRNFDPQINEIENVYLYCVDDLAKVVEENIKFREEDIDKAVEIIFEKTGEFMDWFETRDIGPLVGQIKDSFEKIRRNELERFFVGSRQAANCKAVMEASVGRIVNKLLHCVIKNINIVAKKQGPDKAAELADSIARHAEEIAADDYNKKA